MDSGECFVTNKIVEKSKMKKGPRLEEITGKRVFVRLSEHLIMSVERDISCPSFLFPFIHAVKSTCFEHIFNFVYRVQIYLTCFNPVMYTCKLSNQIL